MVCIRSVLSGICQIRPCPLFTFCPVNCNIGASICLIQKNSCFHPLQWRLVGSRSTVRECQTVTGPKSNHHWDKSIITTVIIIISNCRIFVFPLSLGFYQQQQQQWLRFLSLSAARLFFKFSRSRPVSSIHKVFQNPQVTQRAHHHFLSVTPHSCQGHIRSQGFNRFVQNQIPYVVPEVSYDVQNV